MAELQTIKKEKIVVIIRSTEKDKLKNIVDALYSGGARVLEFTMNTPGVLESIEWARKNYPDMLVGAGTVLDDISARTAIMAGAEFILTPTLDTSVIAIGNQYSVPVIPGVFTPTEVLTAYRAGVKMVKIFPVRSFGVSYIKDLRGPLPHIQAMAVGGISIENAADYVNNGWNAVGVGSQVVDQEAIKRGDFAQLTKNMQKMKDVLQWNNQ